MFASAPMVASAMKIGSQSGNLGGGFTPNFSGLSQLFSGLFGNSDKPYKESEKSLRDFLDQAKGYQNPFFSAGKGAINPLKNWLNSMKDPSGFINNLMGQYQESPWAKFQQQQALRAAGNQGSASGLTGSTPLSQFEQQNAHDISSQDMNQWLQNVLGVNTQYGQGEAGLVGMGQHSADAMSDLLRSFGGDIAGMKYGEQAGKNQDRSNIWGGLFNIGKNGLFG